METCNFIIAWVGLCNKPANESGFCPRHETDRCSCGQQAVGECPEASSLVCGYPTCTGGSCQYHGGKHIL